jgi:hypothetical protein
MVKTEQLCLARATHRNFDTTGRIGIEDHCFRTVLVSAAGLRRMPGLAVLGTFAGRSVRDHAARSYSNRAMLINVSTTDDNQSGWNASRVAFVTTEFDLAKTFALIAIGSIPGSGKRLRNERNARTAYESAIHFLCGTDWSSTDAERLAAKKEQVEDLLRQLTAEPHC